MKNTKFLLAPVCAIIIWGLHTLALFYPDCFGFDQLRYFSRTFIIAWPAIFFILTLAFFVLPTDGLWERLGGNRFLIILGLCWLAGLVLLKTSAPLLGDGFERMNALPAGLLKALRNQPAPLDILVHWVLYQGLNRAFSNGQYLAYQIGSYLAGIIYFALAVILSAKHFSSNKARLIFVVSLSLAGFVQIFAGYAENYCFLPAGIIFWMIGARDAEKGKFVLLALAQIILIFLHFFFLLLLPVTLWLLWRGPAKKPWGAIIFLALTGAGVTVLSLSMVRGHYRGPAIFVAPIELIRASHLLDYINYQLLAAPALLILVAALFMVPKGPGFSLSEKSYLFASLIFAAFFFMLRPVLGAVRDWDLFAIPAMFYMPFLLTFILTRLGHDKTVISGLAACIILASAFHTVPWLMVNHSEAKMIARMDRHLEERQGRERWASSYGFLVSAKYFVTKNRDQEADAAYQQAVAINPDYSVNRQEYGLFLFRLGKFHQAITELETAYRLNPANPVLKHILVYSYLEHARKEIQDRNLKEAELNLEKLFKLAPDRQEVLRALIDFYEISKPDPEKAAYYRRLLSELNQ